MIIILALLYSHLRRHDPTVNHAFSAPRHTSRSPSIRLKSALKTSGFSSSQDTLALLKIALQLCLARRIVLNLGLQKGLRAEH